MQLSVYPVLIFRFGQTLDQIPKLLRIFKLPVDGSKAHVGDRVQLAELLHHELAQGAGRHFSLGLFIENTLNLLDEKGDRLIRDGAFLARELDCTPELVGLKRLTRTIALDHEEPELFYFFKSGETTLASFALPSPPDRCSIANGT